MRVLVSVITGLRPALAMRPTARFFPSLMAAGFSNIEWVVREDQAASYERDAYPLNTYSLAWASDYARTHWRHPVATWEAGGFYGAAPGREWAMRSAEERGYDAVLQMDDNVTTLGLMNCTQPSFQAALNPGAMLRLLAELSASTNAVMLGAQLNSAPPEGKVKVIRPGFPYSVFIDKCGPGRIPYYCPFEDDIMHALDNALLGGPGRTAGVVDLMRYDKESKSKTGMRKHYNQGRGLEIARRYPANVSLRVSRKTSSPNARDGAVGVRHILRTKGFTPVRVIDPPRFIAADRAIKAAVVEAQRLKVDQDRRKMKRRAGYETMAAQQAALRSPSR